MISLLAREQVCLRASIASVLTKDQALFYNRCWRHKSDQTSKDPVSMLYVIEKDRK